MKTLIAAAVVLVTALAVPAALAGPGGPPTFHINQQDNFVDTDFCGTGKPVVVDGRTNASSWIGQTGGDNPQKAVDLVLSIVRDNDPSRTGKFLWIEGGMQTPISSW